MPGNIANTIIASLFFSLWGLAAVIFLAKLINNKFAPIKTVSAIIIDKNIIETFTKYSGNGRHKKYVIIFSINGKKKSFYVSHFSYDSYKINEKGILKYKGDKIVDFN